MVKQQYNKHNSREDPKARREPGAGNNGPHSGKNSADHSLQGPFPEPLLDQVRTGDTLAFLHAASVAYRLEGIVVEGNKIGRTLGYPTANLQMDNPEAIVPGQGVYTAMVSLGDSWHESMVNIGIRPTLDLYHVTIEAHLFDFEGDIYGERMAIHFLERIRDEMRFSSLSELKKQLDADREKTRTALTRMLPGLEIRGGALVLRSS
jgi:hypothetical protein